MLKIRTNEIKGEMMMKKRVLAVFLSILMTITVLSTVNVTFAADYSG